jgi:hypothetical protein
MIRRLAEVASHWPPGALIALFWNQRLSQHLVHIQPLISPDPDFCLPRSIIISAYQSKTLDTVPPVHHTWSVSIQRLPFCGVSCSEPYRPPVLRPTHKTVGYLVDLSPSTWRPGFGSPTLRSNCSYTSRRALALGLQTEHSSPLPTAVVDFASRYKKWPTPKMSSPSWG